MEQWKTFLEYDSRLGHQVFQVSTLGRVRNTTTGTYLKPNKNRRGYKYISINSGKKFRKGVHQVVATMFIPNPNNYPEVDHINGDTGDNRVENLQWCTHKKNMNNPNCKNKMKRAWLNLNEFTEPYKKSELVLLLEKIVPL